MEQTGLMHVSMPDTILPPYFPSRLKVIVAGYRENNNYH
jgi:hypothetical protein